MKKYLFIIMSLLLAVQPAFGAFEGVEKKAVSVKEAVARGRAVLKENWQCFRSGTGPNCTKGQRSALRIIQDFVTGKWANVRKGLKEFYAFYRPELQVTGMVLAGLAILIPLVGGFVHLDEVRTLAVYKSNLKLEMGNLDTLSNADVHTLGVGFSLFNFGTEDKYSANKRINFIDSVMNKVGWNTTYGDKNLIEFVLENRDLLDSDKIDLIEKLQLKGVRIPSAVFGTYQDLRSKAGKTQGRFMEAPF